MAWYERVADDPEGSLARLAEHQGLTVEELRERHRRIAGLLGGEGAALHLGVGDWRLFREAPERLSEAKRAHLDGCAFCQRLGDAFAGEAIAERTRRAAEAADVWDTAEHEPRTLMGAFSGGEPTDADWVPNAAPALSRRSVALPMIGVALATALVTFGTTTALRAPPVESSPLGGAPAYVAIDSVMLPPASQPSGPVALLSSNALNGGWEAAACAPSTWTVSEVGEDSLQLTWATQSSEDLPRGCRARNDEIAESLAETLRRAESTALSVGQNVVVVSPTPAQ